VRQFLMQSGKRPRGGLRLAGASASLALGLLPALHAGDPVVIKIKTQPATTFAAGFSGFNTAQPRDTVEYYDPKFVKVVKPLNGGLLRYPGGTVSLDFDWNPANLTGGHTNPTWMNYLIASSPPLVTGQTVNILTTAANLTQAKGGAYFSDFATLANTLGTRTILCFNSYTDTNHGSATQMAQAAQGYELNVVEWELGNEAYQYPGIYPTGSDYVTLSNSYFNDIQAGALAATVGLFAGGWYPGSAGCGAGAAPPQACFPSWDQAVWQSSAPPYWNAVSNHIYPIVTPTSPQNTMWTLNGILAHGSSDYMNSYIIPLAGAGTPIFITEFNCCADYDDKFLSYLYNGIFLAEYIARLSTVPNVQGVAIDSLYTDNSDYHGLIQSMDDFETYLLGQLAQNPDYSTDTATNPMTQFQFYTSAPGLAMEVANQAINSGTHIWPTTVTGGPTVNIIGFDGNPVPAIYAQAYLSSTGKHFVLITNKSSEEQNATIELNGAPVVATFNLTYVANSSPTAANTKDAPKNVKIQQKTSLNPIHVAGYSVTSAMW